MTLFLSLYISLSILLALVYWTLINTYQYFWKRIKTTVVPLPFVPKIQFSIIIPARNEEEYIGACLQSIQQQHYPGSLWEVIVLDDHSTDQTAKIVQQQNHPNIHVLPLAQFMDDTQLASFKKKAIEVGVLHAKGDWIITTDADCWASPNWLQHLAFLIESQKVNCIAAPVQFYKEESLLERFQSLDFLGMMLITGAGIESKMMRMGNGANLAYSKKDFYAIEGFKGVDHLASGDDMFLIQKMAKHFPDGVGFLKSRDGVVFTQAKSTWRSFFQQRLRWATKSSAYQEWQVPFQLGIVFIFCCNIFLSLSLAPFFGWKMLALFFGQIAIKSFADYPMLKRASQFFNRSDLLVVYWPSQFMHIAYIIIIGVTSNFTKQYTWKGRKVK